MTNLSRTKIEEKKKLKSKKNKEEVSSGTNIKRINVFIDAKKEKKKNSYSGVQTHGATLDDGVQAEPSPHILIFLLSPQ